MVGERSEYHFCLLIIHNSRAHMMSQTHTLYVYWQEPYSNA